MATPIMVVGHRNPDNDSICAAIGYAHLKNALAERAGKADEVAYVAARQGALPPETAQVLGEWDIEAPAMLPHVHVRVGDVMTKDPVSISADATVMEAGHKLRKHNIRSLVVLDGDGAFQGLIATRAIANRYIAATDLIDQGRDQQDVARDLMASLGQKVSELTESNVLVLDKEALLRDVVDDLISSELREGVVLDDDNRCIGIVTRSDIAAPPKRKVVLVDHNETRQSVPGIQEAEVVEIIDHHRIADVMTALPIQFLNLPWGSTATIVASEFRKYGVEVPKPIAAALLSAIMTDTVILKSPTATDVDRDQADYLAGILGVDATEFGLDVFKARGGESNMPMKELVEADSKEFMLGDVPVLIAQHETVDLAAVMDREDEVREHMRTLLDAHGYEFVLFMVTDIMAEGSQFLCEGNRRVVNRVFGISCTGQGGTWMPGVLSRKKQVAAKILG
ncbi:MAG: putative manganese-dependent inorganic diphosphatase [Eggerthellaceae bacterium]|nr:putative manganese-dependent inorganic diphosphatase [Eggerthellaceae bacterium]